MNRAKNEVGILVGKELVEQFVEVSKSDCITSVKLVISSENFDVVSVYAPQIRLDEDLRRLLLEDLKEVIQKCIAD